MFAPGQTDYIQQLNALVAGGSVAYDFGTWTPVLTGATTGGSGTYSLQSGKWTHTGNRLDFECEIVLSAHTGSGTLIISGLPVTSDSSMLVPVVCRVSSAAFTGQIDAYVAANSTQIIIPGLPLASLLAPFPLTVWVTGNYQG